MPASIYSICPHPIYCPTATKMLLLLLQLDHQNLAGTKATVRGVWTTLRLGVREDGA